MKTENEMEEQQSILSHCTSGGCGAKIGPGELSGVLQGLANRKDERLLVGFDASDDAAVYQLDEKNAIISTVDFFSPMVDDAKTFGRIAAANALSDVYAMGGEPFLALNLVCFPENLPKEMMKAILEGGAEKLEEAGVALGGGHSVYDKEIKYGLAVTGRADAGHILRNNTPEEGNCLILTKPLGVGIIMAAHRGGVAEDAAVEQAVNSMQRLNKYAAQKMKQYSISACTDITGFGLLAHLLEMCGDRSSAMVDVSALPIIPEAAAYAEEYLITAAGQRNRNHVGDACDLRQIPFAWQELLFDPQTSGGLLICVQKQDAEQLLADIRRDDSQAAIIGEILSRRENVILLEGMG